MKNDFTCGFIGLGLIGGSIAKAIRQFYPASRLIAYDINQEALNTAFNDGVINLALPSIGEAFAQCRYIFLCAPVSENDKNLLTLKNYLSPDCLLTDAGSVKTDIHKHIKKAGLSGQFIG
ncbi:MAG: prephenate dehydrogenase/arogenate dehydrogenase family protein, partial [Lachnospiraceae bacterium]|nr:prephenate dehydrogenase/arogenate dehydrogenase family protein [Lachnospiraceae bacterium]